VLFLTQPLPLQKLMSYRNCCSASGGTNAAFVSFLLRVKGNFRPDDASAHHSVALGVGTRFSFVGRVYCTYRMRIEQFHELNH
jgi:hypothetical protein